MTQRAGKRASAPPVLRAGAAALLGGLLLDAPAVAGDRALLDPIGYSEDSRYFAFEEYGIQDGSGFPYSSVYVIDLERDAWVAGSPFRVNPDDIDKALAAVRAEARQAAGATLKKFGIGVPVDILALIGDGEVDADGTELRFGIPGYTQPGEIYEAFTLSLETFEANSPEPCADYLGEPAKGFALTLAGDGPPRELHRDGTLPRSRGCPMDYRIYAVLAPADNVEPSRMVVLVSAYPFGFEGPDRRFIALPLER